MNCNLNFVCNKCEYCVYVPSFEVTNISILKISFKICCNITDAFCRSLVKSDMVEFASTGASTVRTGKYCEISSGRWSAIRRPTSSSRELVKATADREFSYRLDRTFSSSWNIRNFFFYENTTRDNRDKVRYMTIYIYYIFLTTSRNVATMFNLL